jgi:hypothetical protein
MMGGSMPSQPQQVASAPADNGMDFMGFGDDNGFGNQNEPEAAGDDWAAGFGDDGDSSKHNLDFAKSDLIEVLSTDKPGNKQKKAGLGVNSAVNWNTETNRLEM